MDRGGAFEREVRPGLSRLAMKLLGPCTLVQAALPHMFRHTPQDYHRRSMEIVRRNAELVYDGLKKAAGCSPVMPAGSMYMMVREGVWCGRGKNIDIKKYILFLQVTIDLEGFGMDSDVTFTKKLLMEESVFCLPGMVKYSQQYGAR